MKKSVRGHSSTILLAKKKRPVNGHKTGAQRVNNYDGVRIMPPVMETSIDPAVLSAAVRDAMHASSKSQRK
jgi:hypothetical protein